MAAAQGVTTGVDICVGTLSKAFGAHGGFAALSTACKQLLLNRGRSYVFSTALPVPIVAAALAALHIAVDKVHLRWQNHRLCYGCCHRLGNLPEVGWVQQARPSQSAP